MIGPAGFNQAPNTGVGKGSFAEKKVFDFDWIPKQPGCRWFVCRDGIIELGRGFKSKKEASDWIDHFHRALDWRAGFAFKLRGDTVEMMIVDRSGKLAKP